MRIQRDLAPVPVTVIADRTQLNQVMVNLVVNALQAMPDGGTLSVATRQMEGRTELEIADTGCGIPPENMDKIFTPFFTTKAPSRKDLFRFLGVFVSWW